MIPIWKCRFCRGELELHEKHRINQEIHISEPTSHVLNVTWTVCPNRKCQQISLVAKLFTATRVDGSEQIVAGDLLRHWRLLPGPKTKSLPAYIPVNLVKDYQEACAITHLSPNASAMLSRRCVEGLIRDFWKTKPGPLKEQLDEIKDKVDKDLWDRMDAVRKIGNCSAHVSDNLNEVSATEAKHLTSLIERLFDNCYVTRHKDQQLDKHLKTAAQKIKP